MLAILEDFLIEILTLQWNWHPFTQNNIIDLFHVLGLCWSQHFIIWLQMLSHKKCYINSEYTVYCIYTYIAYQVLLSVFYDKPTFTHTHIHTLVAKDNMRCHLLIRTITIHTLMEEPSGVCALLSYPQTISRTAGAGDLSTSWATAVPIDSKQKWHES